ncbi:phage regulatory CII family protein [Chitiniphilus eburneus]|uniref:Uncharacterized protein n=1 Tax=Chitiniphilus eburneus TaxID=2571148 RepID=A0A4U0PX68_9NEIS|nr:phage regulatory CII family protein [Chitiniphilus eburneus]TJZ73176.1 hypothetical protein FAZ21_11195 [Chitiniphilus eburneus]
MSHESRRRGVRGTVVKYLVPFKPAAAIYHAIRDDAGGAPARAPRLEQSAQALTRKVSPICGMRSLRLDETDTLLAMTGNPRILRALAVRHGGAVVEISGGDVEFDAPLFTPVVGLANGYGDLASTLADRVGGRRGFALRRWPACHRRQRAFAMRLRLTKADGGRP